MATILEKSNSILADKNANLLPEHLKSGVTCLGVNGALIGLQEGSADATATANDLLMDTSAYVNGEKIEGKIILQDSGHALTTVSSTEGDYVNLDIDGISVVEGYDTIAFRQGMGTGMSISFENLATTIGLTADKIVSGNTILGLEGSGETGIDTSDATATATDIVSGKTAYINGEKVEGTIEEITADTDSLCLADSVSVVDEKLQMPHTWVGMDNLIRENAILTVWANQADVAAVIGLTADKIKSGETILGITGTYTGEETETVEQIDWLTELAEYTINEPIMLSSYTDDIHTRLEFVNSENVDDTTTLPELEEHILEFIICKEPNDDDHQCFAYMMLSMDFDATQIQSNFQISGTYVDDNTAMCSYTPAYPGDDKTSPSGYKYYKIPMGSMYDIYEYDKLKAMMENETSIFKISTTEAF